MASNLMHLSFTCNFRRSGPCSRVCLPDRYGLAAQRFGVLGLTVHLSGMNERTAPAHGGLEPLLTIDELSEYLGIPVASLYDWRTDGVGPKAVKLGRALRYRQSSVRPWIEEQANA